MVELIKEYRDYFAWDYHEILGLHRNLVEHRLPIMEGCKLDKQPPRRFNRQLMPQIKVEVERLLKAGFIRTARYVEWLSNLNLTTPKDEYGMPVADMLADVAANHVILTFMDDYSRYNQNYVAEADTHKTFFRCPGALAFMNDWSCLLATRRRKPLTKGR